MVGQVQDEYEMLVGLRMIVIQVLGGLVIVEYKMVVGLVVVQC